MKIFQKIVGKINEVEEIYIYVFIISILAGMVYGIANADYYKCCEASLNLQEGDNILTIFTSNFFLSATNLITAGISSIFINFHTFSITSSYFHSNNLLFGLPLLFVHGGFELFGVMLFGLGGLTVVERKLLKKRSYLNIWHLLAYGTILLLIGATIEIGLVFLLK